MRVVLEAGLRDLGLLLLLDELVLLLHLSSLQLELLEAIVDGIHAVVVGLMQSRTTHFINFK